MRTVCVLGLLLIASVQFAWPQSVVGGAAVVVTVVDNWGDGIPDTTVNLFNDSLGIRMKLPTTDDGLFHAPGLPAAPGYRVTITRKGFQPWASEDFQLYTGRTRSFRVALTPVVTTAQRPSSAPGAPRPPAPPPAPAGAVRSQGVPDTIANQSRVFPAPTPAAPPQPAPGTPGQLPPPGAQPAQPPAAPTVPRPLREDLTDSTAGLFTAELLSALPERARFLDELLVLLPTVGLDYSTGELAFRGLPAAYSVFVDGLAISGRYKWVQRDAAQRIDLGAVREAQVLSEFATGGFGMSMGGFVNVLTRTAGNSLHGEAYGFRYAPGLSSVGRFAQGRQLLHRDEQGGVSAGRSIIRNRIFLFANFDAHDIRSDNLNRILNPLITDPGGLNVAPVNCKAAASLCTAAIHFIQPQLNVPVTANSHANTALAKLDWRLGGSNTLFFEGGGMSGRQPDGFQTGSVVTNGGILGNNDTKHQTRFGKFGWTSLPVGTTTNEMRFGYNQDYMAQAVSQPGLSTGQLGLIIAGTQIGATNTFPGAYRERRFEFSDTVSVTTASQVIKANVNILSDVDRLDSLENFAGTYRYSSLTSFAQDFSGSGQKNYVAYTQRFGTPFRSEQTRETIVYAEDTWRALPRLTIDVSLRWDKPYPPKPHVAASFYFATGTINSTNINVAPRAAVAFQATNKMVFRVAYGFYHDPHPGEMLDALYLGNGIYQADIWANPNLSGAPAFPKSIASTTTIPSGSASIFEAQSKLRNPYVQQWLISMERKWSDNTTWSLNLVHNRGIKLWAAADINLNAPSRTGTYTIYDINGLVVKAYPLNLYTTRTDVTRSRVYELGNEASSWYDAAEFQVRRRMAHGLSLQASYVWSHSLDTVGGPPVTGGLPAYTWPLGFGADKGNSASDQRHRATAFWVWQPSPVANKSWLARYLVNGWQLSGMAIVASPEGVTPLVIVGGQQITGVTMAYTSSLNGSGGWSRAPFERINSLKGAMQYEISGRLARSLPFTDKIKGSIMLEGFNVLNHQYTTAVSPIAYTVSAAAIRPVAGAGTPIASQSYPGQPTARTLRLGFQLVF